MCSADDAARSAWTDAAPFDVIMGGLEYRTSLESLVDPCSQSSVGVMLIQSSLADARALRGTSTLEERMRSSQFESLRVSRSRIMTQLSGATNPAHRTMLERALKSINDQMATDEKNS